MKNSASLMLFGLLLSSATVARADGIDHAALAELSRQVAQIASQAKEPLSRTETLAPLLTKRLDGIAHVYAMETGAAETQAMKPEANLNSIRVDFIIAQLELQTGTEFNSHLDEALPGPNAMALFIRGGRLSLRELVAKATSEFPGSFETDGKTYTAHWPIVIWSDSELTLGAGEQLNLSTRNGVFILNSGLLSIRDATISGHGDSNSRRADFKPFIVTAMTGAMQATNASFSDLGFPGSDATSGISIIGAALFPARKRTFFVNSDFAHVNSLDLHNTHDIQVSSNRFTSSLGPAISMKGVTQSRIVSNIVIGVSDTQGISLQNKTSKVEVANNIVLGSRGIGIFAANNVRYIRISKNLVAGNGRGGISVVRGSCVEVTGNAVVENGQTGVKVRSSTDVTVSANQVIGNTGPGVSVVEQPVSASLMIDGNEFIVNRSGVYGGSAREVSFLRNDFSGQSPILLSGEFASDVPRLLRHMQGQSPASSGVPFIIHAAERAFVPNDCKTGS